ncbi:MAG: hypothetical protein AAGA70_17730, partial [Pseudomonadota bacterium]
AAVFLTGLLALGTLAAYARAAALVTRICQGEIAQHYDAYAFAASQCPDLSARATAFGWLAALACVLFFLSCSYGASLNKNDPDRRGVFGLLRSFPGLLGLLFGAVACFLAFGWLSYTLDAAWICDRRNEAIPYHSAECKDLSIVIVVTAALTLILATFSLLAFWIAHRRRQRSA